jgi:RHS repeat-associated protein
VRGTLLAAATASASTTDVETAGAVNLILRPGFDFNDTSLVLYFDAADPGISGWQSWKATVYDPATGAAQDSRQLTPADAKTCQVPATYCRSFGSADGWALVGGHGYYVTITVTLPDGTQVVSAPSATANARTTADPPPLPAAQAAGCACGDALFPTTGGQMVRGSGVNTGTGAFTLSWPDLRLPGFGVTFEAKRFYSSANTTAGSMGVGWSWTYDTKVIPPTGGQTAVTVRAEDGAQAVYTAGPGGTYDRPPGVRSELSAVTGGWRLLTPAQTAYNFDSTGRLVSVLDPHGHGVRLAYTSSSVTVTDAAGRVVTGALNAARLLTSLTLPDRRKVSYGYTSGLLTSATDAAGNTWRFGYTGQLLTSIVDPLGRTQLTNTYSGARIARQVDASGATATFSWDAGKQESTMTDADGVPYYDGYRGNVLVYAQNGNGDTVNQRYDQEVDPNLLVDAKGNQTASTFDPASNQLSVTAPDPFAFQVANTYDPANNLTTHTDALGHTARFGYTATDELSSILTPVGDNTALTYDDRGLITKITDPRGKATTLAYDSAGNLVSQTSPMGEVRTYTYDSSGRMTTSVDPRGNLPGARPLDFTTTYSYDSLDRVVGVLQPAKAHASTTTYDSVGEVTQTTDPTGHTMAYTYTSVVGRTATVSDFNANITSYTYTAAGRRASVTDPLGGKTTFSYDSRGNLATVVSPRGNLPGANPADFTTTYTYDFNNNAVRTSHPYPGGGTVTRETRFDELNRSTHSVDALGNTSSTSYDNNSNVVSVSDPLGNTTTLSYDADGRPTAVAAPAGGGASTEYDAAGNVTRTTGRNGGVTTYSYNDDGRLVSVVDPRGNASGANPADYTASYGYDATGNLTSLTNQLGQRTAFSYDANNRVTSAADAGGHTTSYRYLDDNRLQRVVGPDGSDKQATVYAYDSAGNVTSRTDPMGNTRYTWDKLGRIADVKDPLNRDTAYTYDAEGNLTQTLLPGGTDPATRTITNTYDILNRRTQQNQAGSLVYNFGYDAKNQMTSLADPSGVRTQVYDGRGRLTSVSRGNQTFSYGYDADGNVTSRTWPDGTTITAGYDSSDRMTGLTAQGGLAGSTPAQYGFGYDLTGRLTRTTYPTAAHLVTDRSYDRAGRLSDLNSHDDSGTVARYQVTSRDPVGNPLGLTTTRGTRSQQTAYTYDVASRLTAECVGANCGTSATGKIAYTYDFVGNRLSQTLTGSAGNAQTAYIYDSAHELTSASVTTPSGTTSTAYRYDPSGNLVQAGADTFTYNLDRTLASASIGGSGGTTTQYSYDAQGLQLAATTQQSGVPTRSRSWQTDVNAGLPILSAETVSQGGTSSTKGFLQGPLGSALGMLSGGQVDSYAPDWAGGVADVLPPSGAPLASYDYRTFGGPRSDGTASGPSTLDNPIQFAGGYQDSTLGARYSTPARVYDPATGRFNGTDPVPQGLRNPANSPYNYVGNRSTMYRDPSGASPCPGAPGGDPDHSDAVELASWQLDARYGSWNVYAECPPSHRFLHGQPGTGPAGVYKFNNTKPASIPELIAGLPGLTYVWEVKKAVDQVTPDIRPRGADAADQIYRYVLALTLAGYPNVKTGPDIVPSSQNYADGSVLTIFSAADWTTYAPKGKRLAPGVSTSGIIYYNKTRPSRIPVPVPDGNKSDPNQNNHEEEPKEDPRDTPTDQPVDDPGAVQDDPVGDLILVAAVVAVVVLVVVLLPEELLAAAGAAVVAGTEAVGGAIVEGVSSLASWAWGFA